MKKFAIILVLISHSIFGQIVEENQNLLSNDQNDSVQENEKNEIRKFDYPKGIYLTKDDFVKKTPNFDKGLIIELTNKTSAFRFSYKDSGEKLKDAFAISNGNEIFINIISIIENFDDSSKGQIYDGGKYYIKAHIIGNYLFMSDYFSSLKGAVVGGMIGGMASRREKGIIFREVSHQFHLFTNYDEFTEYIRSKYPLKKHLLDKYKNPKIPELTKIKSILEQVDLP